jgi:hypothetical protein
MPRRFSGVFAVLKTTLLFFAALLAALTSANVSASAGDTLRVVNWNIEYFGDPSHHTPSIQVAGVRTLMSTINADLYAICEVVDVDSFAAVVNSLPGNYGYLVSPFGSFASSPSSSGYKSAQKLGFVYRKSLVRNPSGRAMMSSSSSAYYNFSSGRFPYQVDAEVLGKDSVWHPITFIILHAKAYTDDASCSRRVDGCRELKDTLDRYFAATTFLLLGDYNDDFDITNCSSAFTGSNYAVMVNDSAHYKALTLPISKAGAFSIDGYSSLIDHVIASNEMAPYYVPGSAEVLRTLVKSTVSNYDNNVSDHFPVQTRYVLNGLPATSVSGIKHKTELLIYPNPAKDVLHISNSQPIWTGCMIYDLSGRLLHKETLPANGILDVHALSNGVYLLQAIDGQGNVAYKVFRIGQ